MTNIYLGGKKMSKSDVPENDKVLFISPGSSQETVKPVR